jgi:hypothetical protein
MEREERAEPPIQVECFLSVGAKILTFWCPSLPSSS